MQLEAVKEVELVVDMEEQVDIEVVVVEVVQVDMAEELPDVVVGMVKEVELVVRGNSEGGGAGGYGGVGRYEGGGGDGNGGGVEVEVVKVVELEVPLDMEEVVGVVVMVGERMVLVGHM
ncbi:hypothetical protein V6N13_046927 [Hibiscus sabdariffa]|uniref:Uncharacterized protein n=2 Tax=Hibiscus sabdariffa TaxID=183260 RepID=A0ABR2AST7_9ROSI